MDVETFWMRRLALFGALFWSVFFSVQLITVYNEIQDQKKWYWWLYNEGLLTIERSIAIKQMLVQMDFLFLAVLLFLVVSIYVLMKIWYGGKKYDAPMLEMQKDV